MTLVGVAVFALAVFGPVGVASAFHEGGVAHCDGCHTMHNSLENPTLNYPADPVEHLLKGSDPSSTCLNCHAGTSGRGVLSPDGTHFGQGGDFYWMTRDYNVEVRPGAFRFFSKDDHGHNIIAGDFGLAEDANPDNSQAPGGTYLASNLACTSCHDPHGRAGGGTRAGLLPIAVSGSYGDAFDPAVSRAGNFRLLGDSSYEPHGSDTNFSQDAPIALTVNDGDYGVRTDYGSGMSEWCSNCHTAFLQSAGPDPIKHPARNEAKLGTSLGTPGANYNSYVQTGDFTGDPLTAYDRLVPFERGTTDQSTLNVDSTVGTNGDSNVMCLTCHRAHASAHPNAGKWDFEVELLAESRALQPGGAPDPATQAIYYNGTAAPIDIVAEYGEFQRSLCNKCHVQD